MSEFTIGRLRYLFEAVRLGGVRAAADFLDVAPSAVSRQLALLEKAAQTPLVETGRRGAKPTEAGQLLIAYYREHVSHEEAMISRLDEMHGLARGHIAIGAVQGFIADLMRHALREFNARYPKLVVTLKLGGVNDILQWLEEDEVHLGLTYGPGLELHDARLKQTAASTQPLCAIVPPGHPLIQLDCVRVAELARYPFALAHPGYGTRKIVQQIEQTEGVRFDVVLETDHLLGLTSFVEAGMGITLLPTFAVLDELTCGSLVAIRTAHPLMEDVQAQLVSRIGRQLPVGALQLQRAMAAGMSAFRD